MTSLKTSIKTITYLSDIGCLEIQGASLIILWLVNMHGRLKKKQIAIALFSRLDSRSEFDTLPLFKVKNIESEHVLITLLTRCFRTGIATQRHIATDRIIKGLLGDAIDALASADINAFDEAIEGFCRDITTFTDGFNFRQGQQTDNLLLLADDIFWDRSFTDKLYTELYQLFRQAVIRIDVSERFYTKCMNIPGMLCSKRESISFKEIQLALMYTFYSWDILVRWGHANTGRLDLTQRQSYEALLRNFVEIWEGWTDGLKYISKKTGGQQLYHDTLKEHLFTLPDIVACAVLSGESGSVDWAVDLMNRWLHTARRSADSHNTALFSWQEFIVTQATLDGEIVFSPENTPLRKPVEFSQLQDSFYKNTLTDLRLLTAAFIISKPDAVQNKECQFAVSTLLDGSLVENTGGFERLSDSMATSTDIIDVFIRLLTWDKSERRDATNSPGNIIRKLSSAHGKSLVSGRTYMGRRLGGIEDLIPQIAELSVLRCGDTSSVSHKMKAIVASNVLSYQLLQNIVGNLSSLHNAINKLTGAAFVAENIFNERRQKVSELIQEYQDLFTNQIEQEIINSPVSSTILGNFGSVVSEFFNKSLNKNMLFSLFGNITPAPVENSNIMGRIFFSMDKQDVTDNFSRKIHGFEENCAYALINEHVLDLLDLLSRQPAQRYIDVTSFTELMSVVHDYDDLQEGDYLIVGDERLWDQFNEYRANTIDSVEGKEDILFYDEDRKVQIRGKEKSCSLYIRPHFDAIDAVLVNKNYFEEYKIKSEGENIFTFNAEEVDGKPLEIALHSQYEGEAVFSGQIKIRFTLRNDSVSSQALPGEDAS
ncbi:quinol oxidase subunit [Escherichia coli]|nr:quinol oxidase subunit [Escherichia coli]